MKRLLKNNLSKLLLSLAITGSLFAVLLVKLNALPGSLSWAKIPEKRTELYFANHLSLPKTVIVGSEYGFEFVVRNLEGEDVSYSYEVLVQANDRVSEIDKGTLTVGRDQLVQTPITFTLARNFGRGKVIVQLLNNNQQISFWIDEDI